jgi:hypothetical protein
VYLHDTGWPGQWYVPAIGATIVFLCGVFLTVGFAMLPLTLVPVLGLEVPRVFDGLVGGVS